MYIYNSLTRKKETFEPINPPVVGIYTCGMTVYDYAHIGHGRKYVGDDILRRTLQYNGYKLTHVQNVTDVGHLVSDADEGEDKLEKGAKKTGKTVWEVAEFFTNHFYETMDKLNNLRPHVICKATEHIKEQIDMIQQLINKGFAYQTPEAIYFDVSKFPDYGKLFGQSLEQKKTAVRQDVQTGEHKKNPADFALWFFRVGRFKDHTMHWESPWGDGFPGWHIECSAMSVKYLGEQFDIHTGGIEHTAVHHPNEIAQTEATTGKSPFVKYWIHHGHLMIDGAKMSKSLGNYYTIEDVLEKGFDPLALRYFYLTAHYKKPLNFTWDALTAAQNALMNLKSQLAGFKSAQRTVLSEEKNQKVEGFRQKFEAAISDDLNMPEALAVVWEAVKSNIPSEDKYDLLMSFDEVLGLNLNQISNATQEVPGEIKVLMQKREELRKEGKFDEADKLRDEIQKAGYRLKDTAHDSKNSGS